jgi:hypothetical protein
MLRVINLGGCHSCYFRHRCRHDDEPPDDWDCACKYYKIGKCYTCKFLEASDEEFLERGCGTWCFGGCKKYKRDWKKTIQLLKMKF